MGDETVDDFVVGETTKQVAPEDIANSGKDSGPIWSSAPGESFKLRIGPNYSKNKKKAHAGPALYETVAVDIIQSRTDTRIVNFAGSVALPPPKETDDVEAIGKSGLPRLIVVNLQLPLKPASMFGGSTYYDDNSGLSAVLVYSVLPETVQMANGEIEGSLSQMNQIQLLRRYNQEADSNEDIRRRFKAILVCDNWNDFTGPAFYPLKGFNGKPAIINKIGILHQDPEKRDFLELDIKTHEGKYLARKGLDQFRTKAHHAKIRLGFTIQGEADNELPENIFACTALTGINLDPKLIRTVPF